MSCDYCNGVGVVGGVMPWRGGSAHANPCPYCTSSPAMKFKPGVTPWTGTLMDVWPVDNETKGMSTYAEPLIKGERMVISIDNRWRINCWAEAGAYQMSPMLISELTVLATQLVFDGFRDRYACGVAFEGIMRDDTLHIYMAVPLLSLLEGEDDLDLGTRRFDLQTACGAVGEALSYTLLPRVMVPVSPIIRTEKLDWACGQLGSDRIVLKQVRGKWGKELSWAWYERPAADEDF